MPLEYLNSRRGNTLRIILIENIRVINIGSALSEYFNQPSYLNLIILSRDTASFYQLFMFGICRLYLIVLTILRNEH